MFLVRHVRYDRVPFEWHDLSQAVVGHRGFHLFNHPERDRMRCVCIGPSYEIGPVRCVPTERLLDTVEPEESVLY